MYKLITHSIIEEHFEQKPETYQSIQNLANKSIANKEETHNEEDVVKMNIPLLIRLLEYAREDSKGDVDLHLVSEKIIELSENGDVLTMEHYPSIVPNGKEMRNVK